MKKWGREEKFYFVSLILLILFVAFLILPVKAQNSESSSEWWMFMKSLNHTAWDGVNYTIISGLNSTLFTSGNHIESTPVIANGYVYIGSEDNRTYQLNASNISQQIANFTTGNAIDASPAVVNGYVYIGSKDNRVYQLNASNISIQIANFTTGGLIYSSPAVANDFVYIGSFDRKVYQLNASNISIQIANFTAGDSIRQSSPAVANGFVYIGSLDKKLYQLNASNISQQIANFTTGWLIQSSPAVANGFVYIGSEDKNVYQLNASNISIQIANFTTGSQIDSSPAVANGYVYIGSFDHNLYQLNASNISQQIANYTTGNLIYSSPAVANGYVYIGSNDHSVYQLNATNISQMIATFTTTTLIYSSSAIANSYIYIGSDDNSLYQLLVSNISSPLSVCRETWSCTDWSSCIGGSQTRTCTDSENCGTDVNKPLETQSCTASGSGGVYTPTNQTTQTTLSASPTQPAEILINNSQIGVTKVIINVLASVENVSVTVTRVDAPLTGLQIGLPSGQSYQAFKVDTSVSETDIANATIKFKVNKTWMANQNGNVSDLGLYRKATGETQWNPLVTTLVNQDSQYYYFSAESPGFSTFVVFFGVYECEPGKRRCFQSGSQLCLGNATWLITEKCSIGCDEKGGNCIGSVLQLPIVYIGLIIMMVVGLLITSYVLLTRVLKRGK